MNILSTMFYSRTIKNLALANITVTDSVSLLPKGGGRGGAGSAPSVAMLVTGAKRTDHISPVLRQLHCLPVRQCVVFKIATLVHRSLSDLAPGYLADNCQLVTDARARQLRSADTRTLSAHRTSSCFGDGTFAAAATRAWNSLLADILTIQAVAEDIFIWTVRPRRIVNFSFYTAPCRNIFTYLLT